jgi:hypothetical protein
MSENRLKGPVVVILAIVSMFAVGVLVIVLSATVIRAGAPVELVIAIILTTRPSYVW